MNKYILPFALLLFLISSNSCRQKSAAKPEYLLLVNDTVNDRYGYADLQNDTVIPLGKYDYCFTDTFRTYAIVHKTTGGYYAIDRDQKDLYEVFNYDNGPDYTEDGYFRIIENGKIGYADAASGKVMIKPQYEAAFPFEDGKAKVSLHAKKEMDGENSIWISDDWIYIDKKGNVTTQPE
jgi:hypothetical protein